MKFTTRFHARVYALLFFPLIFSQLAVPDFMEANDTIGFIEEFALAEDREAVLEQLIPGTREYYYFHALHYQNEQQWDRLASIMEPWVKRYGESQQVWEIRNREALLRYPENNKKTLDYLRKRLGLNFNHQQQKLNAKPNLPTSLDQKLISWETFRNQAFRHSRQLNHVEDSGLDRILRQDIDLDATRRRDLLQRLVYPDYERLVGLIAADLRTKESRGFGEFTIHNNLLPEQLDALEQLRPELAKDNNFIYTRIRKLHPGEDVDWRRDPEEREAYLTRVWNYVDTLDPVYNSLKAHILFQLLQHYRAKGEYPEDMWMSYLQLPRQADYIEPKFINSPEGQRNRVDLNANYSEVTKCPSIGNDEPLVRDYLLQVFQKAPGYETYLPYIRDDYLKRVFAETKLTGGIGDAEKWYSLLNPPEVQILKDRVDIEFAPTNREQYLPDDEVVLNLNIKNVKDLVVKVYEINALNYYLDQKRELNTDLNLDGLIANEEFKYRYDDKQVLCKGRTFDLKSLRGKRGVWIIEFIGNGVSSRALVRKGQLQYLSRVTAAGTIVTVLNEANERAENPSVWFGGRKYSPDDKGRILLPFSKSGNQKIILTDGDFATFDSLTFPDETYQLEAGFHIDRETLLPGIETSVAIRPALISSGDRTSIGLLEDVKLVIRSTDLDGIDSMEEVPGFKLFDDEESVHNFRVPQRLQSLEFTLKGKVIQVSRGGSKQDLASSQTFQINGIDQTELIADLHLSQVNGKYVIEVLGKSGEALPERGVNLRIDHEDFNQPINTSLKSDKNGKIALGNLSGIEKVSAHGNGFSERNWQLSTDYASVPSTIHSRVGEVIQIPIALPGAKTDRERFAIMEIRKGIFVADHFPKGKVKDGILEVTGLPAGDHLVFLRDTDKKIHIRISESNQIESGFILSNYRHLEFGNPAPLQISAVTTGKKDLKISLVNIGASTRVHVVATKFLPEFSMVKNLATGPKKSLQYIGRGGFESRYLSGRDIGEEYRYIIERRSAKKFPGNMATRPGLLLNPWALRDTDTSITDARKGEDYEKAESSSRSARPPSRSAPSTPPLINAIPNSPNLDFLPTTAPVFLNLAPEKDGTITLKRSDLGDRQHLHIVAIDQSGIAYRQTSLPEGKALKYRDLRLGKSLEPGKHFTQRRRVTLLREGKALTISDVRASEMETYDTLSGIYSVLSGLADDHNPDASQKLAEFSFILNWPELKEERKRELYSKYASHELSFFLSRRDNEFFNKTIKPYLANKRHKTFMDHYLIGSDLSTFLEPWKYGRLNIVERILLGRRLGGDDENNMKRSVKEWFSLLPSNPEQADRFYQSALRGQRMAGGITSQLANVGGVFNGVFGGGGDGSMSMPKAAAAKMLNFARDSDAREFSADEASVPELEEMEEEMDQKAESQSLAYQLDSDGDLNQLRRKSVQEALFRKMDSTQEWAENNYYHLPIAQQVGDLITVNDFWKDYARWDGKGGFYTRHFPAATRNFAEMMMALAVLDIPFKSEDHDFKIEDQSLTLTANSPVVVFHEEIEQRPPVEEKPDILISQNFFRADDRFKMVEGERIDKFVTREFLTGVLYGCQVVITNPTSSGQKLDLLLQLPEGAVPVALADYTKTYPVRLSPFSTEKLEALFYFPAVSGDDGFSHYPVHVAKDEQPVAWSAPFRFKVVDELTDIDKASWEYLSQFGDKKEVHNYIEQNNVHFLNLDLIAWRMKGDVDFFRQTTNLLRNRHAYSHTLWSYAILHNTTGEAREFLTHQENFLNQSGKQLECELVSIDPVDRHWYQHLEYTPLVNARTHRLGRDRKILNDRFYDQYHQYLNVLSYTPNLDPTDHLGVAYYLFLQDRIEEGLEWFSKIEKKAIESQLQYDFLDAYASLYREEPKVAAKIADQYKNYGVDRWRERFAQIGDQVKEIQGEDPTLTDSEDRDQQQDLLASKQPVFDLTTEGATVTLNYQNVSDITLNYYEMDLEFLFSSQPFVSAGSGQFSYIRPNQTEKKKLPEGKDLFVFDIPERFNGKNVLVEAVSAGQKKSSAVYANTLKVQMAENYGRVQVRDDSEGNPLSKTYVKVYARFNDGRVKFFKDGYTDLRGKFDYVSLNTSEISQVDRFSILIMNPKHGAIVKDAAPPPM